jgi:hypothetical protein
MSDCFFSSAFRCVDGIEGFALYLSPFDWIESRSHHQHSHRISIRQWKNSQKGACNIFKCSLSSYWLCKEHFNRIIFVSWFELQSLSSKQKDSLFFILVCLILHPKHTMQSFISLWIIYITSGMTCLNDAIRIDSIHILNTFLQYYPSLVAPHYAEVRDSFCGCCSSASNVFTSQKREQRRKKEMVKKKRGRYVRSFPFLFRL